MLQLAHQGIAFTDLDFEPLDLRPLAAADVDQRNDPIALDAVVALDHRRIGLDDQQPIGRRNFPEHTEEIFAIADRGTEQAAAVILVGEAIEGRPALATGIRL